MVRGQPETVIARISELLRTILAFTRADAQDELLVRRLERELKGYADRYPAAGGVLGELYAQIGDEARFLQSYDFALTQAPGDLVTRHHFARQLFRYGHNREALAHAGRVLEAMQDSETITVYRSALTQNMRAFELERFKQRYAQAQVGDSGRVQAIYASHGVTDEQAQKLADIVWRIYRRYRPQGGWVEPFQVRIETVDEEYVSHLIAIDVDDAERLFEMNMALVDAVVDAGDGDVRAARMCICPSFVPLTDDRDARQPG